MANSDLQETGPNTVAYSVKARHIQEVSRDITAHSEACVTPVYSETWYIQNHDICRNLEHSESWYNPGAFRTLVYTEPWHVYNQSHIQNRGIFRISSILTTLQILCDRALYEYNANSFLHYFSNMANCNLSETGRNKIELVLNIVAYSNYPGIFRHIQKPVWPWYIQNPCIFRTLIYSEPCYIQNQSHIQNTHIFKTTMNIYNSVKHLR